MNDPGVKTGDGQERDLGVQNEFFNEARKARTRVAILLNNGKRLTGRIKAFDRFALIIDAGGGAEEMVFKHAIATVSIASARSAAREFRGGPQQIARSPAGGAQGGQPHAGSQPHAGRAAEGTDGALPIPAGEASKN